MDDTSPAEQVNARRIRVETGAARAEMHTILGQIRRRPSGEPTRMERARLATLKTTINQLRNGT